MRSTVNALLLQDVSWLAEGLPNLVEKYRVSLAAFNHLDYLWAIDGDTLVYNHIKVFKVATHEIAAELSVLLIVSLKSLKER